MIDYDKIFESGSQIGKGPVEKGGWFEVWKYEDKFYAVLMSDPSSCWVEDVREISESEIDSYGVE